MKKQPKSIGWAIVGLLIAAAVWYFNQKNEADGTSDSSIPLVEVDGSTPKTDKLPISPESERLVPAPKDPTKVPRSMSQLKPNTSSAADGMFREVRITDSKFTVLKGCRMVEQRYGNDGDSFLTKHSKGETNFRLYYVDAAESWYKKTARGSKNQLERLKDQGNYWGGLSVAQTMQLGIVAKKFVIKLLREKPFKVITKWENVYSPERKYAFVIVEWKGKPRYLHEILVAKGLARIHTKPMPLPDSTSSSRHRAHLKVMEAAAKVGKIGAWSIKK